jgi:hypothetical protein
MDSPNGGARVFQKAPHGLGYSPEALELLIAERKSPVVVDAMDEKQQRPTGTSQAAANRSWFPRENHHRTFGYQKMPLNLSSKNSELPN